jgi:hypothetical protein
MQSNAGTFAVGELLNTFTCHVVSSFTSIIQSLSPLDTFVAQNGGPGARQGKARQGKAR